MVQFLSKQENTATSISSSAGPQVVSPHHDDQLKSWSTYINEHYDTMTSLKIIIDGHRVFCGDKCLDLTKKVKMLALFKVFAGAANYRLSKEKLVEKIYLRTLEHQPSLRQQICLEHNIVKLLSRARKIAQSSLGFPHQKHMSLDWFVYDPYEKAYQLFRLRNKKLWF